MFHYYAERYDILPNMSIWWTSLLMFHVDASGTCPPVVSCWGIDPGLVFW